MNPEARNARRDILDMKARRKRNQIQSERAEKWRQAARDERGPEFLSEENVIRGILADVMDPAIEEPKIYLYTYSTELNYAGSPCGHDYQVWEITHVWEADNGPRIRATRDNETIEVDAFSLTAGSSRTLHRHGFVIEDPIDPLP